MADLTLQKKQTISILSELYKGVISIETAQRQLFYTLGITQSIVCKLDRLPKDCSIYLNISKDCKTCGHYFDPKTNQKQT